jgi:hypothetical protein
MSGPLVDLLPPTWRDNTVRGGEFNANGDPESAMAIDLDGRVAHHEAHESSYFLLAGDEAGPDE